MEKLVLILLKDFFVIFHQVVALGSININLYLSLYRTGTTDLYYYMDFINELLINKKNYKFQQLYVRFFYTSR